jgi:uncharacterized protein (TIGR03000 family)
MFLKTIRMIGVLSLALLGDCLVGQPAAAQEQGWPFAAQSRWWESGSSRANRSSPPSTTQIRPAVVTPAALSTQIQVQVPAQAKVWFDGRPTVQSGKSRGFRSPPLTPGFEYRYAVRVEWRDGDSVMERNRTISFMAGDTVNVDFTMPEVATGR